MNKPIGVLYLLIAVFLFFRWLRANKGIIVIGASLFFSAFSLYEMRKGFLFIFLTCGLIIVEIYAIYLKMEHAPRIAVFQKGFTRAESILHYVLFGIIVFATFLALR